MAVRRFAVFLLLLLAGCGIMRQPSVVKIALLAPFEGRYREVGYDALYAARLALVDSGVDTIDLLPIDDGGSVESAIDRAHAIQQDPAIAITLILGIHASDSAVQSAFGNHLILIVGHWNTQPTGENVSILTSREIDSRLTMPQLTNMTAIDSIETSLISNELLALQQVPLLREDLTSITVLSSANLSDADFVRRYTESDVFAPQPGLLATLTYDAMRMAIDSIINQVPMREMTYEGINGVISFDADGYWADAPVHEYQYENGVLTQQS